MSHGLKISAPTDKPKFAIRQRVRVYLSPNQTGTIENIYTPPGREPVYGIQFDDDPPGDICSYYETSLEAVGPAKVETPEPKFALNELVVVLSNGTTGKVWGFEEVSGTSQNYWKYRVVFNRTGWSAIDYYESELSHALAIADPQIAFKDTPPPKFNAGDLVIYARQFSVTITSVRRVDGEWCYQGTTKAGTLFEFLYECNIQRLARPAAPGALSDEELGERLRVKMGIGHAAHIEWANVIRQARAVLQDAGE